MIPAEILRKIKRMHIKTARDVTTVMSGQYRSAFRGSGIEFEEVREYSPGDDVKSIDWKVSARLNRPFIKRYREERELVVILLLDMSASGNFGTSHDLIREKAAETAAVLAFNAIRNNDKVGAILFTDRVEKYIPPQKGSAHVWRVIKEIYTFTPKGAGTDIREAAAYLGRVVRKKSVAFIISDFLAEAYLKELAVVSKKHEMIGVILSDPGNFFLPDAGIVTLRDLEIGNVMHLDAYDGATRRWYEEKKKAEYQEIIDGLKRLDIDRVEIGARDASADELARYFRFRERRKR